MNPIFLLNSDLLGEGVSTYASLYLFRKKYAISEKGLFVALYILAAGKESELIAVKEIGEALGEKNRSNLFKAVGALKAAGMISKDEKEREGRAWVRYIRLSKKAKAFKELVTIVNPLKS